MLEHLNRTISKTKSIQLQQYNIFSAKFSIYSRCSLPFQASCIAVRTKHAVQYCISLNCSLSVWYLLLISDWHRHQAAGGGSGQLIHSGLVKRIIINQILGFGRAIARALRAPVCFGSLTRITGSCAPSLAHRSVLISPRESNFFFHWTIEV